MGGGNSAPLSSTSVTYMNFVNKICQIASNHRFFFKPRFRKDPIWFSKSGIPNKSICNLKWITKLSMSELPCHSSKLNFHKGDWKDKKHLAMILKATVSNMTEYGYNDHGNVMPSVNCPLQSFVRFHHFNKPAFTSESPWLPKPDPNIIKQTNHRMHVIIQ